MADTHARRAGALGAMLLLATLLSGCQEADSRATDGASASTSPVDSSTSASAAPSLGVPSATSSATSDPSTEASVGAEQAAAHAVDDPGSFTPPLHFPDIEVVAPTTLDAATIDRIKALPQVQSVEVFSMAQTSIENRLMRIVAVDPATFRNYTPSATAQSQDVWDRVAGGELAISPQIKKRLPIDKQGYVALGSDADASKLHVGAYAPMIPGAFDAIVNEAWGKTLDITQDNALLVSTGAADPTAVRKKITKLLPQDTSVQGLDVVARYGLDPGVVQTATVVGSIQDAIGVYRYRSLGNGQIAADPSWVAQHIATETVPILGAITCNKMLFPQLRAALEEVVSAGLASTIHPSEYGGCYNARFIAGTTTLSNHAFGLAIDLNVPGNGRGTVGEMNRTVVAIFEKWGFTWGGTWHYTDPMHFEMNRLVSPR